MKRSIRVLLGPEFITVATGQAAAFIGGIVAVKLLTRAMSTVQYGTLTLSLTAVTLAQQLAFSPCLGSAGRFYALSIASGQSREFTRSLMKLFLGGLCAVALLLGASAPWMHQRHTIYFATLAPLAALIFITAINATLSAIQSAARERIVVGAHDAAGAWLRGILAWVGVTSFSETAAFALWGQFVAGLVVSLSQITFIVRLFRKVNLRDEQNPSNKELITSTAMWRFGWPYSIFGSLYWCGVASERWALDAFHGTGMVGIYQAAYQIGYSPLSLCLTAIQAFVAPILFQKVGNGSDTTKLYDSYRLASTMALWTIAGAACLAAGSTLIRPDLYRLLVGQSYLAGAKLVPFALLSAGLFAAGQFLSLDYLIAGQSARLIYPKMISSILACAFAWVGAKWAGPRGVFIGSGLANALYIVLTWAMSPARKGNSIGPAAMSLQTIARRTL